jgi:hypothetical protein
MRKLLACAFCFLCASGFAQTKPDICIHLSTNRADLQLKLPELATSAANAITKRVHRTAIALQDSTQQTPVVDCEYELNMKVWPVHSWAVVPGDMPLAPRQQSSSPSYQRHPGGQKVGFIIDYSITSTRPQGPRRKGRVERVLDLTGGTPLDYDSDPMLRDGINDAAVTAVRKILKTRG